ncbi:cupin domain-containing protein [Falsiroseomonas sp. HW251]|uniref:cupin domain-containing protein n=1 Tax=Falsiroseomonas sp. HW251 TaxID=3390998 RepID=UPI003D313072
MLSRRKLFAGCAICAATGLVATDATAQAPAATRTILQSIDMPGTNLVTHNVMLEMAPGAMNPRHTHPGVTLAYIIAGDLELTLPTGKVPARPGESFQIAPDVPHTELAGPNGARVLVTFTIEKGKPLVVPAPG